MSDKEGKVIDLVAEQRLRILRDLKKVIPKAIKEYFDMAPREMIEWSTGKRTLAVELGDEGAFDFKTEVIEKSRIITNIHEPVK